VRAVEVDLADDRFDVSYDPAHASEREIVAAVQALGYAPELVRADPAAESIRALAPESDRVDLVRLSGDLALAVEGARALDRPLLIEFFAPG
jgi:hypothetical protein